MTLVMWVSSWMMSWVLRAMRAGELGGQGDGFVERVGVQGLGAAEDRRHRFDGGPHHVVVRILLGQRPAGGLAVVRSIMDFWTLGARTGS